MSLKQPRGQLLLIEPAIRYPNLDCLNELALISPLPVAYHLPALYGLESMEAMDLDQVRGAIVVGSAASVNDGLPWQVSLSRWLRELWARGLPTLGICYGHQLIAKLFGGRVGRAFSDGHKECGFRRVRLAEAPPWAGPDGEVELCVSHREAVLECPPELRAFASSESVPVEAIAHRELPIFGFQAHLEATPLWLTKHDLHDEQPARRIADGQRLLRRFVELVAGTT